MVITLLLWIVASTAHAATDLGTLAKYYDCLNGLSFYSEKPVERVGPRRTQTKDFAWQQSFVVIRHNRIDGRHGFFIASRDEFYFVPVTAPTSFLELRFVSPKAAIKEPLRMLFSPAEARSEETDKMFPIFRFPPGTQFQPVSLYLTDDPELFAAFAQDLDARVPSVVEAYEKRAQHGQATALWAGAEVRKELERCEQVPDSRVSQAALVAIQRISSRPGQPVAAPDASQAQSAPDLLEELKARIKPWLDANGRYAAIALTGLLLLLVALRNRIKERSIFRQFLINNNFRVADEAIQGVFKTTIQNMTVVTGYVRWPGGSGREFLLRVPIEGSVPFGFMAKLKRSLPPGKDLLGKGASQLNDDTVFDRYVQTACDHVNQLPPFLTPWRRVALVKFLSRPGYEIEDGWLMFRRRGLPRDPEEIWAAITILQGAAAQLQAK